MLKVKAATLSKSGNENGIASAPSTSFFTEEYKQMKIEVATMMARIETLMRLSLIGAAAAFSWLFTQGFGPGEGDGWCLKLPMRILEVAWYIPPWLVFVASVVATGSYFRGQQMSNYICKELEPRLAGLGRGWETTLKPKFPLLLVIGLVYWSLLLGGTVYGAVEARAFTAEAAAAKVACAKN